MRLQAKTFQSDGINLASGLVVERSDIVHQIISTAKSRQQIVVSSPPATGKKVSVMTLVKAEILKHTNANTEEAPAVNIILLREVHGDAATLRYLVLQHHHCHPHDHHIFRPRRLPPEVLVLVPRPHRLLQRYLQGESKHTHSQA
jgi:hypothetical protein